MRGATLKQRLDFCALWDQHDDLTTAKATMKSVNKKSSRGREFNKTTEALKDVKATMKSVIKESRRLKDTVCVGMCLETSQHVQGHQEPHRVSHHGHPGHGSSQA
eukprot:13869568-Heterocapsa_arctica.AAC.1